MMRRLFDGAFPTLPEGTDKMSDTVSPASSDAADRSGFLKSRVYAKLLRCLILECYQTFNGSSLAIGRRLQNSGAYQIGK